ncbi:hypothetical protein DWU98_05570 [Dyella monticola]|uniref:Uncharacterized protein n=1 Tax=Dyella monticola TaxID=1927958 RepID=A0A370X5T3_9GAMM|nr:hypothetical protein DWU98_05570 [Dyella monticola]
MHNIVSHGFCNTVHSRIGRAAARLQPALYQPSLLLGRDVDEFIELIHEFVTLGFIEPTETKQNNCDVRIV